MSVKPIQVSPATAAKMLEAIKMLCGVIEGYPDIDGYPDVKACRMTAHALVDQVVAESEMPDQDPFLGYSPDLVKACEDPFHYAVRLRTGEIWYVESATAIDKEWVRFTMLDPGTFRSIKHVEESPRPPFDRGVDVRVSDIVWIADAPYGS